MRIKYSPLKSKVMNENVNDQDVLLNTDKKGKEIDVYG